MMERKRRGEVRQNKVEEGWRRREEWEVVEGGRVEEPGGCDATGGS